MNKLKTLFLSIIIALAVAAIAFAWTNPSGNPPSGGGALYYSGGNVGIGTTGPGAKLSVQNTGATVTGLLFGNNSGTTGDYQQILMQYSQTDPSYAAAIRQIVKLGGTHGGNLAFLTGQLTTGTLTERMRIDETGNVGIGTTGPGYTLTINGTAWVTSGAWSGSDIRWKKNIKPLENSLNKILSLQGVNFEWKKEEYPDLKFNDGVQIGLIAQDTAKILPEIVTTDNNGYMGISYERLTPVLVEAIKELKAENEALKNRIEILETR